MLGMLPDLRYRKPVVISYAAREPGGAGQEKVNLALLEAVAAQVIGT